MSVLLTQQTVLDSADTINSLNLQNDLNEVIFLGGTICCDKLKLLAEFMFVQMAYTESLPVDSAFFDCLQEDLGFTQPYTNIEVVNQNESSSGLEQSDYVYILGISNPGNTFSIEINGEVIEYVVQVGDNNISIVLGLLAAASAYAVANPTSDWALNLTYYTVTNATIFYVNWNVVNVPYTINVNYQI